MEKNPNFKILVVDDSPELLDITLKAFSKTDYQLFSASNGTECINLLHNEKPDIILLDLMLPDVNSIDLCRKIKRDPEYSSVYIILLSSLNTDSIDVSEGQEEGADSFIRRPVESRELLARIEAACRIINAEKKIRENEMLFKTCIDSPKDMIVFAIDKQYNYLVFNKYHKDLMSSAYGSTVKSGMNLLKYITNKDDVIKTKINFDRALAGEANTTVEEYGDLDRQCYETRYSPIYDNNREITGVTAFASNVTEKVRMEGSLKENERLLKESQAVARLGSYVWNLTTNLWRSSEILNEIFGINENYVRSFDGWNNIIHPAWQEIMTQYVTNEVLGKRKKFDKEYQIIRQSDGHERWVHGLGELEYDDNKKPVKLIGTIIDITDRKRAVLALTESEERFRTLFENSTIGIYRTTPDGRILLANPTLVKILGYPNFEELSKRNLEQEGFESTYERSKFMETVNLNKEVVGLESSWLRLDGVRIFVRESARAFRDADNKILYYDRTVEDITERKLAEKTLENRTKELQRELSEKKIAEKELKKSHKLLEISKLATLNLLEDIKLEMEQRTKVEEEVKKLNSELEQRVIERTSLLEDANKELQAFAYSVSHDLRAPLRAINGFSEFIVEDYGPKLDTEGKRLLGLIRSNTRKMDQLITDILSLSRVSRGEHKVSKIDMTKMAMSMLNETASSEIQKEIKIIVEALPEASADPTYMKQVWINLISNAIKFSSGKKKPEIKISGYTENEFNIYYVKDNGVGFNPEYAHKLFGVFQRLHQTEEFEGTGVGLAIVQRIIHRHGGKVWAEGKVGSGATFYFSLPFKKND